MSLLAWLRLQLGRSSVRLVLGLLVTGVALVLVGRQVNVAEVWAVLARADSGWVALALAIVGLNNLAKALRWRVLLGTQRQTVPFPTLFGIHLIGQALNVLIPLRVGEVVRIHLVGRRGAGRSFTAGTVALEKVVDMLCYALLFFCSFFSSPCRSGRGNLGGRSRLPACSPPCLCSFCCGGASGSWRS